MSFVEPSEHSHPVRDELLAADDATIDQAVSMASPMVLRGLIYQLTGDEDILATQPIAAHGIGFFSGVKLGADEAALVRERASAYLKAYRDSGAGPVDIGPTDRMETSIALTMGKDPEAGSLEMWREELAIDPWCRGLEWSQSQPAARENFLVTVIGAGMGGLNAAIQLKRAGIPFRVIEKNDDVGGTWYENRYPGARVDTPSRIYTHIFGVDFLYPYAFCPQRENQRYLEWVADEFDLRGDITFATEVRSLVWNETTSMWDITMDGPNGRETLSSNGVITGVGFLNRPKMPDIAGMETFRGPAWHTARWPEAVDLKHKRVAVIGTGCTGIQMVPELARLAANVTVFQRTPQWLFPTPKYLARFPPQVNWLDRNLPFHTNFTRLAIASSFSGGLADLARFDPNYQDEHAVNATNKAARDRCIAFLEEKLSDPDLVSIMTPGHPVLSARPVLVDPEDSFLDAIRRSNVTLVTDPISEISECGIETSDGFLHEVDAIVYATGFEATDYLFPMSITGKDGTRVEELWAETGAQAYRGAMIPGCPNLWTLYGPNTNGGLLVPAFQEMEMYYALKCIERLILERKDAIEVKETAYRRYNAFIDAKNSEMAWSDPRADNYYWTTFGRSSTQNPLTPLEMWNLLHTPDFNDLEVR